MKSAIEYALQYLLIFSLILCFHIRVANGQVRLIDDPFDKEIIKKEKIKDIEAREFDYASGEVDLSQEGFLTLKMSFNENGDLVFRKRAYQGEGRKERGSTEKTEYRSDSTAKMLTYDYKGEFESQSYADIVNGKTTDWVSFSEDSVQQDKVSYKYDAQGNMTSLLVYEEEVLLGRYEFEYDAQGELAKQYFYGAGDELYTRSKAFKKGPLTRVWKEFDNDGYQLSVTTKVYDELGRLINETSDNEFRPNETYVYIGNSNLIDYVIAEATEATQAKLIKYYYTLR